MSREREKLQYKRSNEFFNVLFFSDVDCKKTGEILEETYQFKVKQFKTKLNEV